MRKRLPFFIGVAIFIALAVFLVLLYVNLGFLNLSIYFKKADPYTNSMVLFYSDNCVYCNRVDTFIKDNTMENTTPLIQLNVNNSYNKNELADKAQICGLDINTIGVPFLWDGPSKKCVIGYVDIIAFFRQKKLK